MESSTMRPAGVNIYGAFGEYQRTARERKFRIAEREDNITNLRSKLSSSLELAPQLKQKCENLTLELKVEEAQSLAETEKKMKQEREAEEILDEYDDNFADLEKVKAARLRFNENENVRKIKLQNLERDYMEGYKKIPEVASLMNASNELKNLQHHSIAVQEKLFETRQNLLKMQPESHYFWKQFVGNCVELAKNWKSKNLNQLARKKHEEEKKLQQIEKEKLEAQKRAFERRYLMGGGHSTMRLYGRVAHPPSINQFRSQYNTNMLGNFVTPQPPRSPAHQTWENNVVQTPIRNMQAPPTPTREIQVPPTPIREIQAPQTPIREMQAPPTPIREIPRPQTPIREIQAPPTPILNMQAPPTPIRNMQAPQTPIREIQAPPTPIREIPRPQTPITPQRMDFMSTGDIFVTPHTPAPRMPQAKQGMDVDSPFSTPKSTSTPIREIPRPQTPITPQSMDFSVPTTPKKGGGDVFVTPAPRMPQTPIDKQAADMDFSTSTAGGGDLFSTCTPSSDSSFSFFNFGGPQEQSSQASSDGGGFLNFFGNVENDAASSFNFFGADSTPTPSSGSSGLF